MTSLNEMRRELHEKFERLRREGEEERKRTGEERFLVKCKHCGEIMQLGYAPSHIRDVHGMSIKGRKTEDDFIILGWKVIRSSNPDNFTPLQADLCYDILLSIESELSHIISDVATYRLPANEIGRRLITIRDELRKDLRTKFGYIGVF